MHGPATVGWLLAAVCTLTGAACLLRAAAARSVERQMACSEALMGFGMAAMALPPIPSGPVRVLVFAVLFAGAAGWEAVLLVERLRAHRAVRHAAHHLHHGAGALAMVYMCLAMPASHGDGHHHAPAPSGVPLLTAGLLAYFGAQVLRDGARLLPAGGPPYADAAAGHPAAASPGAVRAAPAPLGVRNPAGFAPACRLAMGTAMFTMLLPW